MIVALDEPFVAYEPVDRVLKGGAGDTVLFGCAAPARCSAPG